MRCINQDFVVTRAWISTCILSYFKWRFLSLYEIHIFHHQIVENNSINLFFVSYFAALIDWAKLLCECRRCCVFIRSLLCNTLMIFQAIVCGLVAQFANTNHMLLQSSPHMRYRCFLLYLAFFYSKTILLLKPVLYTSFADRFFLS